MIFSREVDQARHIGLPIVALESTIISHGMPFPQNLEVANEVENVVRMNGAVPATIAILNGKIHIGLNADELENFASLKGVIKCSRRDLPYVIASKMNGATTVAATMILAEMAAIRIFATGGIGGVHRMAETSFDISADLLELARTNVAVVSAGAKAILDLPKTMEYLETQGVPVIGYQSDFFPSFYARTSPLKLQMRVDTPDEIAAILKEKWNLKLNGGVLIANPIPEEFALDEIVMNDAVNLAIVAAGNKGIFGKELTPFLLQQLNEITMGKSQIANKALVLNNAVLGARIAVAMLK